MIPALRDLECYDQKTDCLVITKSETLNKHKNANKCQATLNETLLQVAREIVRGEAPKESIENNSIAQ